MLYLSIDAANLEIERLTSELETANAALNAISSEFVPAFPLVETPHKPKAELLYAIDRAQKRFPSTSLNHLQFLLAAIAQLDGDEAQP